MSVKKNLLLLSLFVLLAGACGSTATNGDSDSNSNSKPDETQANRSVDQPVASKVYDVNGVELGEISGEVDVQLSSDTASTNVKVIREIQTLLGQDPTFSDVFGGEQDSNERLQLLQEGGYKIYSTIDADAQAEAAAAIEKFMSTGQDSAPAVLVSIDNATGGVAALHTNWLSSADVRPGVLDGIESVVGSAVQPLILAALFESGYTADDTVDASSPCDFKTSEGEDYTVTGGGQDKNLTVGQVSNHSYNCGMMRLGKVVGADNVEAVAKRMQLELADGATDQPAWPLGDVELSVLDMAAGYSAFPKDGVVQQPLIVSRIEDAAGEVVYEHAGNETRAISPNSAKQVTQVLEANVQRTNGAGTGRRAQVDGVQIAGETGTSFNSESAWFIGFSSQYTTLVLIDGGPEGLQPEMFNRRAYEVGPVDGLIGGGIVAAPIFAEFMTQLHDGLPPVAFDEPDRRTDRVSQLLTLAE